MHVVGLNVTLYKSVTMSLLAHHFLKELRAFVKTLILYVIALLLPAVALAAGDAARVKEYETAARQGDYQAQRNLAFTLATSRDAQVRDPFHACAWYRLILLSGSPKLHEGDAGNVRVYCGQLTREQQGAAEQQAQRLYREIYKK